jgi:hypothetical protein
MMRRRYAQPLAVAGALAFALAGAACNNADNRSNARGDVVGTSGSADKNATPMTVTGCLQEGNGIGRDYILTEHISTSPVGTNGAANGAKVEREETKAAEHSYRLSGESDHLKKLVGHQVRITGTLADKANIAKDTPGTSGAKDANASDRKEIKEGDLAKIDVKSVDDVSANCGRK